MAGISSSSVTVASAGTAVRFTTAPTPIKSVLIHANATNSGIVYVGDSTTSATTTPPLAAGSSLEIKFKDDVDETAGDLSDFWLDSASSSDGVTYIAVGLN